MEPSPQVSLTKRSLEAIESVSEDESKEKRPRLVSELSDDSISEIIFMKEGAENQDITDGKDQLDEPSPTEVIYELSPDNNESLLSVADSKTSSQQPSPSKSAEAVSEESDKNDEIEKKQEMEEEESDENEEEEEHKEKDENSEESSESGDSEDDSNQGEDDDDSNEGNEDNEEATIANKQSEKSEKKDGKLSLVSEDESESEDETEELVGTLPDTMIIDDDAPETLIPTLEKDPTKEEKSHAKDSSEEEEPKTSEEKQKKTDQVGEAVDGGRTFEKSADYSKKSVEDLEDLQEDIHKELAQITGKTQKHKHKKTSSSNQREKRHKDKSSSRHKEKEREKEKNKEKQWSSEPRGHSRKDYEKERKHYETEETQWSHDSRRRRPQKDERRDWNEQASWTQTHPDRPPSRTESRNKNSRKEGKETKVLKEEKASKKVEAGLNGSSSKDGVQKRVISDSMRVMIKETMIERKGFSHEIVDEDSDDSEEHLLLDPKTSDISAASSSDEEPDVESSPEVPKLPPYLPAIRGCRNVEEFQWLNRIEEGTYGVVYRAKDKRTGEVVALKKLKMEKEKEGFPITSLREINTLLKAQHPNIVTVQEIVVGSNMDKIYIVMDFVEHDLKALMETMTQAFLGGEIKTIMIQLLRAVNHLHDNWILHRDIKTSNLLLSNKGILKVGDFGLAREYGSPLKPYTPIVVTLWYRAPELLLGAKEYSTPIDLWSVGCVFAELLTMKPLFNGQSEISQINKIFKELGTPSDKIWPGPPAYSEFPATKKMTFADYPYNNLRNRFGATLTDNGFDLLNSFLTYDPKRRITAEAALKHEYFKESPSPVDPSMFPSWPARSEGAKRAKKASPKAPEGGNFYKTLSGDGDGAFHIPAGKAQGSSAVPGFTLKF